MAPQKKSHRSRTASVDSSSSTTTSHGSKVVKRGSKRRTSSLSTQFPTDERQVETDGLDQRPVQDNQPVVTHAMRIPNTEEFEAHSFPPIGGAIPKSTVLFAPNISSGNLARFNPRTFGHIIPVDDQEVVPKADLTLENLMRLDQERPRWRHVGEDHEARASKRNNASSESTTNFGLSTPKGKEIIASMDQEEPSRDVSGGNQLLSPPRTPRRQSQTPLSLRTVKPTTPMTPFRNRDDAAIMSTNIPFSSLSSYHSSMLFFEHQSQAAELERAARRAAMTARSDFALHHRRSIWEIVERQNSSHNSCFHCTPTTEPRDDNRSNDVGGKQGAGHIYDARGKDCNASTQLNPSDLGKVDRHLETLGPTKPTPHAHITPALPATSALTSTRDDISGDFRTKSVNETSLSQSSAIHSPCGTALSLTRSTGDTGDVIANDCLLLTTRDSHQEDSPGADDDSSSKEHVNSPLKKPENSHTCETSTDQTRSPLKSLQILKDRGNKLRQRDRLRYNLRSQRGVFPFQSLPIEILAMILEQAASSLHANDLNNLMRALHGNAELCQETLKCVLRVRRFLVTSRDEVLAANQPTADHPPYKLKRMVNAAVSIVCLHPLRSPRPFPQACNRPPMLNVPHVIFANLKDLLLDVRCGNCLRRFIRNCGWRKMPSLRRLSLIPHKKVRTYDFNAVYHTVSFLNQALGVSAILGSVTTETDPEYIWAAPGVARPFTIKYEMLEAAFPYIQ